MREEYPMRALALILCLSTTACLEPQRDATAVAVTEQDSTRVCGSPPTTCWPSSNVDQCSLGCRLAGFEGGWCPGYTFDQYWYCFQFTNIGARNCKTADGNEHRECLFDGGAEQCVPNWPILCNPGFEP